MKRLAAVATILVLAAVVAVVSSGGGSPRQHAPGFATQGPPASGLRAAPPQPTLEMFDSIEVSTVPSNPRAVAGYTSGHWPTFNSLVAAFPRALHVSIAVSWSHRAECLDDEPGDATPAEVVPWVRAEIAAGNARPCVYASVSQMFSEVNPRLATAGLAGRVRRWCAWYRFHPGLIAGCDAVQWTDRAYGRNLDESTVAVSFFGVKPKPKPKPDPYRIYDKTRRHFRTKHGTVVASEHSTVAAFDKAKCRNPVKRPVCKSSHYHIALLRDRLYHVATVTRRQRGPATFGNGYPSWNVDHRGQRFQGLSRRLRLR